MIQQLTYFRILTRKLQVLAYVAALRQPITMHSLNEATAILT
jgi:hypothetical protein